MASQIVGYKYFTNFLLFIGNPIEKLIGINFDKRGWLTPLVDENSNHLSTGSIDSPTLYGETEGGVAGAVYLKTGTNDQEVVPFYKDYMESKELQASAYPYQSYLAFKDFYVGNSGYMKEMLLWPKRIHVRNDGRGQWYDAKAEIDRIRQEINPSEMHAMVLRLEVATKSEKYTTQERITSLGDWTPDLVGKYAVDSMQLDGVGYAWNESVQSEVYKGDCTGTARILFSSKCEFIFKVIFHADSSEDYPYTPQFDVEPATDIISSMHEKNTSGTTTSHEYTFKMAGGIANITASVKPHNFSESSKSNRMFPFNVQVFYPDNFKSLLIPSGDINPIHKIREIITDDTAMKKPESSVNDDNFIKAADRVWDECLGISWSITEKSCIDAINELCYHIEAGIRINRQTGLYEVILFHDDWFEEDEIHSISESKIKSMQYEITNADEVVNQVNVNFYDRVNIKNSSFSISESGLIQTLGRVNAETVDFPYFMNMRNAEIVANWKLKLLSTGVYKGTFTTGWREARKWNRYDLIRLPWSKRWTGTILVRIMSINLGGPTNNEVSIDFIEVVPSTGMMNTNIVADDAVDTKPQSPQPCNSKVFELPYFEAVQVFGEREVNIELTDNSAAGYLCAIAEKPQNNSLNAALYVDSGNGFERAATINYCETADLDQAIDRISNTFVVKNVGNIASVRVGSQIFINDEIMVYQSYDAVTKVLTVKRGVLETIPQIQALNSMLYFADDFVAVDQTIYVDSEVIEAKALTTTPSGILALDDAVAHEVEFKARAIRPYPPADVKINDAYFPETTIISNNIVLTWVHRNRVQQTGGEIIGWYDGSVTTEEGVTYFVEISSENTVLHSSSNISVDTYTIPSSVLIQNKPHKLKLWSVRDGYESYQKFEHSFFVESASLILTATASKDKVIGNTVPIANISVNVDELLKANMNANGLSISGKAEAGATITIQIEE